MNDNLLFSGFLRSAQRSPDRPAVIVNGETLTYGTLFERASSLAATLQQRTPPGGSPLTAVFADRSSTTFAGILGALLAGRGYVPLNQNFPVSRTQSMLLRADCRSLIVDTASEGQLDAILAGLPASVLIVLPERGDVSELAARWPVHTFVGAGELESARSWTPALQSGDETAYLLFTSGSTGVPKGVMVTHRNVAHFVRTMVSRYGITAGDRFSQTFDVTFDLSVFDMFVAWHEGACVCCPSRKTLLNPDRFIRQSELTVWFSVPSLGVVMNRLGALKAGRYPSLRWSLFCGEPLPTSLARAWHAAAPSSQVENLYGPTELTVACTAYRWDPARTDLESDLGIVPIGEPCPGMTARVVDDELCEVPPGAVGELLMAGPQRVPGYWRDPNATARAFVRLPGIEAEFYRTGDRVRKPVGDGPFTYAGRVDHQIKVLGHRVELGEVESALREEAGVDEAVAIGWPVLDTGAGGIVAFLSGSNINPVAVRSRVSAKLQTYAVPRSIHVLPALPQNANGKVDRQALVNLLQQ